jgi:cytochrome c-type biogenesis protein CcmH/NrfG
MIVAALCFLACLGGAFWLGRTQRERTAFAVVVGAPLVAALAFAGVAALPHVGAAGEPPASTGVRQATAPVAAPTAVTEPAPQAAGGASEVDGWRHEAGQLRSARRFAEARAVYAKIVAAVPRDADAWADLADASAAAADGNLEAGREAIERALEVDPDHLKALWLKASLELQARRYASAAELWQHLLARLPPDSNDARIVRANLEETRTLAAEPGSAR